MKSITGDLILLALAGEFDVIVHGCNCMHIMGAGIAREIRYTFPEAYEADLATRKGDLEKLGTFSSAQSHFPEGSQLTVVNAYTQFAPGGRMPAVDYAAVERVFQSIGAAFPTSRIGYPMIGAGLAGGDWNIISKIIDSALEGMDHTLVTLTNGGKNGRF
ncbi:MAG: phosphatase [Anaerolineae bacterium]|nr:phosphatase [Anaerolineae bacterium]